MPLPNFLIIGATKAGTTSLYDYMRQHPDVFMPGRIKEPNFFCYHGQTGGIRIPVKTAEAYRALFAEAAGESAVGEASPHYLSFPGTARRIKAMLPAVRIIASLRNPVDRSFSVYQMNLRDKGHNEGVPYLAALRNDPWLREGYRDNLQSYFAEFPASNVKVILFEDITRAPLETLRGLFGFLEVDGDFAPDISRVSNAGGLPRLKRLHSLLNSNRAKRIGHLLPAPLVAAAKRLRERNLEKQSLPPAERAAALEIFREDILRTQDLIGRDLGHWLRT